LSLRSSARNMTQGIEGDSSMRRCAKVALGLSVLATSSADATQGGQPGFWVVRDIRQGMTEAAFYQQVTAAGWKVSSPFNDATKGVSIDGTNYWLSFCEGKLIYASWLTESNDQFIESMNARINDQGFRLTEFLVSSKYSDSAKKKLNDIRIRLEKQGIRYSITYSLYGTNGQIALEDSDFDDSLGCDRDSRTR